MSVYIEGLKELKQLHKKVTERAKYIAGLNGTKQSLDHIDFAPGPKLHQDSDTMTEEESALFEKDNPQLVAYLESLSHKLDNMLRTAL